LVLWVLGEINAKNLSGILSASQRQSSIEPVGSEAE